MHGATINIVKTSYKCNEHYAFQSKAPRAPPLASPTITQWTVTDAKEVSIQKLWCVAWRNTQNLAKRFLLS